MSQSPGQDEAARAGESGRFSVMRVIILVVVGCVIGGGIILARRPGEPANRTQAASPYTPHEEVLRSYALPPAERKPALDRLSQLVAQRDAGELTPEAFQNVLDALQSAPLRSVAGHDVLIGKYVASPMLTDDQRDRGSAAKSRYLRGLMDGRISARTMDDVLEPVRRVHDDNAVSLDPEPPAEQIVQLIERLELHADGADIPAEPFEVDYAAELLRVINDALPEPAAE